MRSKRLEKVVSFNMPVPKWMSEFGINMVGLGVLLLQQQDFEMLQYPRVRQVLDEHPCHIYMICRRPRIMFDATSIAISKETISGNFLVQDENTQRAFPFAASNCTESFPTKFACPYPHTVLTLLNAEGNQVQRSKAAVIAGIIGDDAIRKELALEVLYVGQAYGEDGSRTAVDRLQKHETLQAIYSEAMARSPHLDIWIALWSFTSRVVTAIDGRWSQYGTTTEEDDKHIEHVLANPVTEQQEINFTEAALIRYFQPTYNKMFKNNFPSPAHATYRDCYNLDINSILLELDTEIFNGPLWSDAVQKRFHHIIKYQFHSPIDRRSMFEFTVPDEYAR